MYLTTSIILLVIYSRKTLANVHEETPVIMFT